MSSLAVRPARGRDVSAGMVLDHSSDLRFLLVEDSATDSELVRALLEDEFPNGAFDVATSLERALRCLEESEYDVILADLTLPDAAGEMVVRAMRAEFPQTALMVLTGRVDGTLALWTLAEGAQDYLVKGEHDGPRLAEAVLHGLQRSRTEQRARARLVAALQLENEAAEKLRELESAQDDFVATASHELRTPLTSIAAYAELLEDEQGLSQTQTRFVAAIVRNAARLTALIDDLLVLSGINSPQEPMDHVDVDLTAVLRSAREVVELLGVEKRVRLRFEAPARPVVVTGDFGRLERVVLNLLSNAIKFSEPGGTVTCRLSVDAPSVLVEVSDTGMGIPEDERGHLFTKFFRGSQAHDRAIQGTGLGLHITESIVDEHDGDVTVESVVGGGTTFTVRLPARPDGPTPAAGPAPAERFVAQFFEVLGLCDRDHDRDLDDTVAVLEAALDAARQTQQWDLLADALRFAQVRWEARGHADSQEHLGVAFTEALPAMSGADRRSVQAVLGKTFRGSETAWPQAVGLGSLGGAYVAHLLRGDRTGALALVRRSKTDGLDVVDVIADILEPAQREVGRRWASGLISVAQEHFCTAATETVLQELASGLGPATGGSGRLVAVDAPGSRHRLGLQMVTDVLASRGWDTIHAPIDLSVPSTIDLLVGRDADLLLVSASMPSHVPYVKSLIRAVRNDPRTAAVKVVVGGRPFLVSPELVNAVGADGWASGARSALATCRRLTWGARALR